MWIGELRGLKHYNTVHCSFNPDLTYSCPHDSSSSLDPSILNFRHSRPSLIVIPRTEMMSARNRYNTEKTATFVPFSLHTSRSSYTLSIIALKWIAKHITLPQYKEKKGIIKKRQTEPPHNGTITQNSYMVQNNTLLDGKQCKRARKTKRLHQSKS